MALTKAKLEELIAGGDISIGAGPHSHGNITTDGKVGTTADLTLMTGAGGLVVARTMAEAISVWKFTNPNLLHNWDFRETPVNQRGVSGTISAAGYFYDRWILNSGIVTTNAAYLTIGAAAEIEQRIEGNLLAGAIVTVSVDAGGTVYSGTGTMPTSAGTVTVALTGFGTATLGYAAGYMYIRLSPTAASNVQRVKLELGTVSTLAYDPPMDYGTTLRKCQRYFITLGTVVPFFGFTNSTTDAGVSIPIPATLRIAIPSLYVSGASYIFTPSGSAIDIASFYGLRSLQGMLYFKATVSGGLTTFSPVNGYLAAGGIAYASADL